MTRRRPERGHVDEQGLCVRRIYSISKPPSAMSTNANTEGETPVTLALSIPRSQVGTVHGVPTRKENNLRGLRKLPFSPRECRNFQFFIPHGWSRCSHTPDGGVKFGQTERLFGARCACVCVSVCAPPHPTASPLSACDCPNLTLDKVFNVSTCE